MPERARRCCAHVGQHYAGVDVSARDRAATRSKNRALFANACCATRCAPTYLARVKAPTGAWPATQESIMPAIKLHFEQAEYDAIVRFAEMIHVKPEAVAYCALNRLMLDARNPELPVEIAQVWAWHRANLPLWSDSACSVHAYEGKADAEPEPSAYI
jgi:hypothetical protein